MTVLMAIGMGFLLTTLAVAIGGIVIKATMLIIRYSLMSAAATVNEQVGHAVVFRLERREDRTGAVEWADEVAA
ncbi:MAG: hypothetical protein ACJ74J_15080 [Blastocatellia bacterium]